MKGILYMLEKFLDALRESIITQAAITFLVVGAWVYITIVGRTPSSDLTQILMIVIGFYFGSKVGYRQGEVFASRNYYKRMDDPITEEEHQKKLKTNVLGKN
jgi:Na+/H+ antiporter NhaC